MNKRVIRGLRAGLVAVGMCAAGAWGQHSETEPNGTAATANGPYSTPLTFNAAITPTGDMDVFAFTLTETSSVRIEVYTGSPGVCNPGVDTFVDLLAPNGTTVLASNDDTPTSTCSVIDSSTHAGASNLAPGTYFVRVRDFSGFSVIAAYTVALTTTIAPTPLGTAFTYQGVLDDAGVPANGEYDLEFSLWLHPVSNLAAQRVAGPVEVGAVAVEEGLFTASVDFGAAAWSGDERYVQVGVRPAGAEEAYTILSPRTRVGPTPYALRAQVAPWAGVSGKPAGFADGLDNTGPWAESGSVVSVIGKSVGIGTDLPGAFSLAVFGAAAKSGGGSWSVFSDARLKHDIVPLSGTLDRLLRLRGYSFTYHEDALARRLALPGTQIGLLAEEVEQVFPDWVEKDAAGYRYVTERATTALMVEALRDLRAEKDAAAQAAQAQIDALRDENARLKARLDRLEEAVGPRP